MKNKSKIYIIMGLTIILDQLSKWIIQKTMNLYQIITIIPNFFSLQYVKNTGAAFSILENATALLVGISVVFLIALNRYMKKEEMNFDKVTNLSLGILVGGVFGNLIDRILYHSVIDFLAFHFGNYNFPIFNIADIGITVGVTILLINTWFKRNEETHPNKNIDK